MGYAVMCNQRSTTSDPAAELRVQGTLHDHALWECIRDFALDGEGEQFPFSERLARENGWSRDRSLQAIEEYKKFVYLMCISGTPLTPSEDVDQVWHLHLVYTRSYWKSFCDEVLSRRIHHEPTKGGAAQTSRFADQYATTCRLYEREFGCPPPTEFWPTVAKRFAAPPRLQWVDRRSHWVLRKPEILRRLLQMAAAVPLALLTACSEVPVVEDRWNSLGSHSSSFGSFLPFIVFVIWMVLLAGIRSSHQKSEKDGKKSEGWWSVDFGGCSGCGGCGGCGG